MMQRGNPRCRWEDNIKSDLTATRWNVMKWINLRQNSNKQHVPPTIIMKLEVLQNVGNLNEELLPSHKESAARSL